jgi:hypothetical protein
MSTEIKTFCITLRQKHSEVVYMLFVLVRVVMKIMVSVVVIQVVVILSNPKWYKENTFIVHQFLK